jgi:hypothetical protein
MVMIMKLNEIREIVAFMKEAGVSELEYTERSTSIRLKLTPPAPQRPWDRFRVSPEAPEAESAEAPAQEAPQGSVLDLELGEAAEKVRQGAVKAGEVVMDTMKAGASYLKSRRDEYLTGDNACGAELTEEDPPAPAQPREESPGAKEASERAPQEHSAEPFDEENPVKLDMEAAKAAVTKTAEVVVNTTKAAVELGVAGMRRGSAFLSDFLSSAEDSPLAEDSQEDIPAENAEAPEGVIPEEYAEEIQEE